MGEIEELEHGTGSPSEPSMFRTHKVSSVDSLAGLAIKYGVTISDTRRGSGGTITDQTMFARGTVRIPRHRLGEGPPLPGGGGVTGAMEPSPAQRAAMTPALAALRDHYGTIPKSESGTTRHAGDGDVGGARRAFGSHGEHVPRKTILRASSGGEIAMTDLHPSRERPENVADTEERMRALGLSNSGFHHGRNRPLMSPPARTKSGSNHPSGQNHPSSTGAGTASVMGLFDKMKKLANTPAMAHSASSASTGMKAAAAVASQRMDAGLRDIGAPGMVTRKASSQPAGRKGKGD